MKNLFLYFIIVLAFILRIFMINNVPPGLTWDEASIGYNAYSILKTGKDEYGQFLPINFTSFGDYKPGVYIYLTVPFVAILGLTEFAVRLPSVLAGTMLVLVLYLLSVELFKNKRISILVSLFLAISPYAIQYSRVAYEANLALLFNSIGVLLFLKAISKQKLYIWSTLFFVISLFTYQASRLFVPLILFLLMILNFNNIKYNKYFFSSVFVLAIGFICVIGLLFYYGQSDRLQTLNFFAYQRSDQIVNQIAEEDQKEINNPYFQLIHGEWFAYIRGLFERALMYISPKMLFIDGDYNQRQRVPDMGLLFYFSLILIPLGIIYLIKNYSKNISTLIIGWFFISIIPAVLSRDLLSTLRSLNMVVSLIILEGLGFVFILEWLKNFNKKVKLIGLVFLTFIMIGQLVIFFDRYYIHLSKEYSQYWLYGYKQAVLNLQNLQKDKQYSKIFISSDYGQPYIYYLFYTRYNPVSFQKQAMLTRSNIDVGTVGKIDNIEFRHIYWPSDKSNNNSLFVGTLEELPDKDIKGFNEYTIKNDINFLNNTPAFRIVETQ